MRVRVNWTSPPSPLTRCFSRLVQTPAWRIHIHTHTGCIVLYNIPPTPVHVPRRFVIFCCTWTPPRRTPSPAAALNTKYRRAHPNVRPGPRRRRRSRYYYMILLPYGVQRILYSVPRHNGRVICTRKQKPGEISPVRVYISPENDNNNNNTPARSIMWLLCAIYNIIMLYTRHGGGRGPLAVDPPPNPVEPRNPIFGRIKCSRRKRSHRLRDLYTARRRAVGKTFISYIL